MARPSEERWGRRREGRAALPLRPSNNPDHGDGGATTVSRISGRGSPSIARARTGRPTEQRTREGLRTTPPSRGVRLARSLLSVSTVLSTAGISHRIARNLLPPRSSLRRTIRGPRFVVQTACPAEGAPPRCGPGAGAWRAASSLPDFLQARALCPPPSSSLDALLLGWSRLAAVSRATSAAWSRFDSGGVESDRGRLDSAPARPPGMHTSGARADLLL